MGLGAMAKRQVVEDAPDAIEEVAGVTAPAAAAANDDGAPAVARPHGRGNRSVPETQITDEVGDSFADAAPAPSDTVGGPAASNIEDALRDSMGPLSADAIGDELPAAPVDEMPPAPGTEEAEEQIDEVLEAAGADPMLDLSALGLGHGHSVLVELLRSALPQNEAVALATEYSTYLQTNILPRLAKLDLDKKERERLLQMGEKEAAYQMGGGSLVSLLSRMGRNSQGAKLAEISEIGNKRRAILDEQSGFADAMRQRVGEIKKKHYLQTLADIRNESAALARSVVAYNQAFMDAPGAEDLKAKVLAQAAAEGVGADVILTRLGKGDGSEELLAAIAAARETALSDDAVKQAAAVMEGHEADIAESLRRAMHDAETLQRNFPESFTIEESKAHLTKAMEMVHEAMPDTVAEEEEKQKLKERMQELMEALGAGFDAIFSRLAAKLGVSPS